MRFFLFNNSVKKSDKFNQLKIVLGKNVSYDKKRK